MANPLNYIEILQQTKQTIFVGDHSAIYRIACAVACIAASFSLITWYNKMLNDPYGRLDMRSIIRAAIVLFLTCNFYSFVLVPFDHLTYLVTKSLSASVDEKRKDAFSAIVSFPVYSAGSVISLAVSFLTKIVQWILTAVSSIFLIVLGLIGPLVFALSLIPGFANNISVWIARYIQISFWSPMAALVDYVNYKITGALVVTMFNNPTLMSGVYNIHLILLELVTLICLLAVPQMASWLITSAGASDVTRGMANTAQKGAMLLGKFK